MLPIPKYTTGQIVYIIKKSLPYCVEILSTSILVEDSEIYYKVKAQDGENKNEEVINEDDILRSDINIPVPAFSVGDIIYYNKSFIDPLDEKKIVWDVFSGTVETIFISISAEGYTVGYKTDEHKEDDYVLEDDICGNFLDNKIEEKEDVG